MKTVHHQQGKEGLIRVVEITNHWIPQKTEVKRKQSMPNFPKKRRCAYQEVRNVRFSENLACFVFLLPPFWDSPFCPITNELKVFIAMKVNIEKFLS